MIIIGTRTGTWSALWHFLRFIDLVARGRLDTENDPPTNICVALVFANSARVDCLIVRHVATLRLGVTLELFRLGRARPPLPILFPEASRMTVLQAGSQSCRKVGRAQSWPEQRSSGVH